MKVYYYYYYYYLLLHDYSLTVRYSYGHLPGCNFLVTGRSNLPVSSSKLEGHT